MRYLVMETVCGILWCHLKEHYDDKLRQDVENIPNVLAQPKRIEELK